METVTKPKIEELIDGFNHIYNHTSLGRNEIERESISERNKLALANLEYKNYNIENFHKLIQAIDYDGLTHFNMTTFIANIKNYDLGEYGFEEDTPVNNLALNYRLVDIGRQVFDTTTKSFNCDSVGCIAGFATANALDWKQPVWMNSDSREYLNFFEHVACNYLNIPLAVGIRIFYGDGGSVWSYLRFYEPDNYSSIQWEEFGSELDHLNCDYDDQWQEEEINLSTIDYKAAIDVLNRIASGNIRFDERNEYLPHYKAKRK